MKINGVRASKKTYYSPKLNIYGGIRELTRAVDMESTDVDNPFGINKTNMPTY